MTGTTVDRGNQTEQTLRFFDAAASGWTARYSRDAAVGIRKARFQEAVRARLPQPSDILDFGCGSGDIALHLSEAGHCLVGYDLSSRMIAMARQADRHNRVQWLRREERASDRLPFTDARFDAVVASSVLEYVANLGCTLDELARILRPGGWLLATVPDARDPHRRLERWLKLALVVPGIAQSLGRSRWQEGAAYLRISANRMVPEAWRQMFIAYGLSMSNLPESTGPLLLLTARKI